MAVTTLVGRSAYVEKAIIPILPFPTERLYPWVKGLRGRKAMCRGILFHSLIGYIIETYRQTDDSESHDSLFDAFVRQKCHSLKLPYPLVTDLPDFLDRLQCLLLAYWRSGPVKLNVKLTSEMLRGSVDMIAGKTLVEFKSGDPAPEEDTLQLLHYVRLALVAGYDIETAEIVYLTYAVPIVRLEVAALDWANIKLV